MQSCFISRCVPLLVFHSVLLVNGQTTDGSTASTSFIAEENVTVEVVHQQHNGALVTTQDKENIVTVKKILYPILLFFGTFGNVMTIVIHRRGQLTSSLSVFFIVLAVADLMLLYTNCFDAWLFYVFRFNMLGQHTVLCKLLVFLIYVSGVLSAWTLVAMTAQRAVCVMWPHRANVLCTAGKSKVIVVSISLFIAAIHTHLLYGVHVEIINGRKKCVRLDEYAPFSTNIWNWVDIVIFSFLPWLCLAVSNSLLVWKLNVSVREAEVSLGAGQTDRIKDRKQKAASVTVTLVAVSTAFLVLTLPMSVIQILSNTFAIAGSSGAGRLRVYHYVSEMSYVLWYVNSCINFYIYSLTGSKFRREAKQILRCIFHEDT